MILVIVVFFQELSSRNHTQNPLMMKTLKIVFVLVFFCFYSSNAQKIDSLLNKLKVAKEDTNKVKLLNKIGNYYKSNKYDSAKYYFQASKKLSEQLDYPAGVEWSYLNLHGVYLESGKYDSSLIIIKKGLALIEKSGNKKRLALAYENMSSSYRLLMKIDSSRKYDLKAQAILEALNDKKELVVFYGNLCAHYVELHQFEKGIEYGKKAEMLSKQGFGDENDLVYVLNNISTIYIYLNQNENAYQYGKKCIELCKKVKNYSVLQVILGNMMLVKLNQKKYNDLFGLVDELKELGKHFDSPEFNATLNFNYSLANFYIGKDQTAKEFALKALVISEPNKLSILSKNTYALLDRIESVLGNYEIADIYSAKRDSISDMQINIETSKNIQELEKKYETQKKENEILKLNEENIQKSSLNKILIASTLGLLLLAFLGYRNFKNRQQLQQQQITELEKDKQLLAINSMLKGQEDERNRIAKDLHDGLGGMLSGVKMSFSNMKENLIMSAENGTVFEHSISQLDNTISELRKIAHNLMPEALVKFGLNDAVNDFCTSIMSATHIHIIYESLGESRKLDNTANTYIYRIIQELINNAVKHGQPSQILVQLTTTTNKILITVEDDGKGMDLDKKALSKGMGLNNIEHRVNYFKGDVTFEPKNPHGTVVNIELNV